MNAVPCVGQKCTLKHAETETQTDRDRTQNETSHLIGEADGSQMFERLN